jgi:HEAT repeat protein
LSSDPALSRSILDAVQEAFAGEDGIEVDAPTTGAGEGSDATDAAEEDEDSAVTGTTEDAENGGPSPADREALASAAHGPDPASALSDASLAERRRALAQLAAGDLTPKSVDALTRVLAEDPDPDTRLMAAEALVPVASRLSFALVQRALQDPSDRVRAAAVGLAVAAGPTAVATLIPLLTARRWPLAQEAALLGLPQVLATPRGPTQRDLESILGGIGSMDPPPLPSERPGLEALARRIGRERLLPYLSAAETRRVGATWLLFLDGTAASLSAVAAMTEDEAERVRDLAARAGNLLAKHLQQREEALEARHVGQPPVSEETAEGSVLASLVRALVDPQELVRSAARTALERVPDESLSAWVEESLRSGSEGEASMAAAAVEHLRIEAAAPFLLERASRAAPQSRGAYLGALESLQLRPERLVELVQTVDPTYRQAAVRLAWQVGGRGVVPFLPALLSDSAGPVRMTTLEVIGESGDPSAITLAQELLENDSSAAVRAIAVHLLLRSGQPTRSAALARALSDPDPDVRATAVEAIPPGVAGQAADALLPALQDEDERVWHATLRHLATLPERNTPLLWSALRLASRDKREELIHTIEQLNPARLERLALSNIHAVDRTDRGLAVELAARAATPESTEAVVSSLEDPDPQVRRAAATAMSMLRTPAAVAALARRLSDPHAEVRVAVVRTLGLIDDDGVPPVLIAALQDPEVRVREMAAEALTGWRSPPVARRLAAALGSPDLRRAASDVLQRMGDASIQPLLEVVMGRDPEAAAEAGSLLERIAGPERFVSGLDSTDPEERLRSVEVLGAIGGPVAAEALLTALTDPDVRVRIRSASLLGALGDGRAAKPLRRMVLGDPVAEVAAAAETALRLLEGLPPRKAEPVEPDESPEEIPPPYLRD